MCRITPLHFLKILVCIDSLDKYFVPAKNNNDRIAVAKNVINASDEKHTKNHAYKRL